MRARYIFNMEEYCMKKIKFSALVALLLCMLLLLTSCTFFDLYKLKLKKVYKEGYADETTPLTRGSEVTVGGDVIRRNGRLFYLREASIDGTVHRVYDLVSDRTIYNYTDTATVAVTNVQLYSVGLSFVFSVVRTDTTDPLNPVATTELYSVAGTLLDTINGNVAPAVAADLVQLNEKCYRVSEGGDATVQFTSTGLGTPMGTLGITDTAGGYYHAVTADSVTIYDGTMTPTAYWKAPSYVVGVNFFVLNGGNVLIQYQTDAAEDAKLYTYLNDAGNKKTVTTLVLKAKKGKVGRLASDFLFFNVRHRDSQTEAGRQMRSLLVDKITTVAYAAKITNRRIDASPTGLGTYLLSDTGRVRGTLNATLTGQSRDVAVKLADDRFSVELKNGQTMLVTTNGEVLSEISSVVSATPSFLVTADKVFNYQMNVIYDLKENKMTVVRAYDGALVLKKNDADEWHLMAANGQVTYLAGATNNKTLYSAGNERYFVLHNNTDGKYEYYNESGAALFTGDAVLTLEGGWHDYMLLRAGSTYYRFAA